MERSSRSCELVQDPETEAPDSSRSAVDSFNLTLARGLGDASREVLQLNYCRN